jgi:organic radical activating enzyme
LTEAWNSEQIKETRLAMIRGEKPELCRYCWDMENEDNTQGNSIRLEAANERNKLENITDRIEYARTHGGELSDDYLAYDFQLSIGNLCNLACKMCNPGFSTQFQKFYARYHDSPKEISFVLGRPEDHSVEAQLPFNTTFDWPIKQDLKDIFKDHISKIQLMFFTGGEPTLIPQVVDFIDHLAEVDHHPNLKVWPSTNCTNINKRLLDSLSKHNHLWINLSLDGKDEIAAIQRTPSHWPSIEKNVDMLMDWVNIQRDSKLKHIKINMLSTITALNFHHILDFWKYFDDRYSSKTQDYGSAVNLVLNRQTNFGIEIIPKAVIPELKEKLEQYRKLGSKHIQRAYDRYDQLLESTTFADNHDEIHFCLDRVQTYHLDLNIKEIYSIYYK